MGDNPGGPDDHQFWFVPRNQTDVLYQAEVSQAGGLQILQRLALPYASQWAFMFGDDGEATPATLFLVSLDYIVAVDCSSFTVGSAAKLVSSSVPLTTVTGATYALTSVFIARASTPDQPGQIITLPVLGQHTDVTGPQQVMYVEQAPNTFFATALTTRLYWVQSVPAGHGVPRSYGLLWQYDVAHAQYQNLTVPFNSGGHEHFGAATATNTQGMSALLVSGPMSAGGDGFWVHSIGLQPFLSYDGALKQADLQMPALAAPLDLLGPGTAVVGARNRTGDVLAMYSYMGAAWATESELIVAATAAAAGWEDPPTCSVATCGPTHPCGDASQTCYEFQRQIYCCVVSPYPASDGDSSERKRWV